MPDVVASLHSILPEDEIVPEWVMLIPGGSFSGTDGRGPWHMPDAKAVITASMKPGTKLVFDQDHATDHSLKTGAPAPARGWINKLEERDGAVWGQVEWTDTGREMLSRREYRGISPVFEHRRTGGQVTRLLRATLTNAPNLADLPSLHSQEPRMDFLPAIRVALGLPETADETAVLAAATASRSAVSMHAQHVAAIATAAKLDPKLAPDAIVTALQARKPEGDHLEGIVALQSQLLALQTESKRAKAETAIDVAMQAGKPIPPASREDFITRHMADPDGTDFWLGTMVSLNAGGVRPGPIPQSGAALDAGDMQVAAMMGRTPEAMLKAKKAIAEGAVA